MPAFVRDRVIRSDAGFPDGVVSVSVDMSERIASERARRAAGDYLRAVMDSVGEGLYTADLDGRVTYMNDAAEQILGWRFAELEGRVMHDVVHSRRPDGSLLPRRESPILRSLRDGGTLHVEDEVFVSRDRRLIPIQYTVAPFDTEAGVEGCVVAFEDVTERRERERRLERDAAKLVGVERIQDALSQRRLLVYAQPIIDLRTGAVIQRELLLRIRNSDGSVVGPGAYLPIAEEYGLIGGIDRWVIGRAARSRPVGSPSRSTCRRDRSGIRRCSSTSNAGSQSTDDPRLLVFEITETALVRDVASAVKFGERLRAIGCKLALDDFGTGWGSFTYLKQLSVDYLKIDVEFVRDLASSPASRHVVEAVVALSRAFSLQTVGEGVENGETLALLQDLGVDFAQGFHIGAPAPIAPAQRAGA